MTRVLYIHHGGVLGGAPASLLQLLRFIDRTKYEPIGICTEDGPAVEGFRKARFPTIVFHVSQFPHTTHFWFRLKDIGGLAKSFLLLLPDVVRLRRLLKKEQIDLVHLNESSLVSCAIAAHSLGIPVIWHIRSILAGGYLGIRRALLRKIIHRYAARIIAISRAVAVGLGAGPKVRVIYNGIDLEEFRRDMSGEPFRREFGLTPDDIAVGVLGQILEVKGYREFLEAAAIVAKSFPQARFFIIGEAGEWPEAQRYLAELRDLIRNRGMEKNVIFTGARRDIPACIAGLDIVAMPSWEEPFGRPIIEAGAMGKPVVASSTGGPKELIEDGKTGLLVPPRNPEALAKALTSLLNDPMKRKRMGEAAHERIKALCDIRERAFEIFALYDEVLGS